MIGGLSWRERLADLWDRLYLCRLLRRHHVKMDSRGRCYRCGRGVTLQR